jgi:hypothetical protein
MMSGIARDIIGNWPNEDSMMLKDVQNATWRHLILAVSRRSEVAAAEPIAIGESVGRRECVATKG